MLFNTDKCKVMHFGYKNNTAGYSLGNVNIQSGKEEKDLTGDHYKSDTKVKSTVRSSSKHSK